MNAYTTIRDSYNLIRSDDKWLIDSIQRVKGWLDDETETRQLDKTLSIFGVSAHPLFLLYLFFESRRGKLYQRLHLYRKGSFSFLPFQPKMQLSPCINKRSPDPPVAQNHHQTNLVHRLVGDHVKALTHWFWAWQREYELSTAIHQDVCMYESMWKRIY